MQQTTIKSSPSLWRKLQSMLADMRKPEFKEQLGAILRVHKNPKAVTKVILYLISMVFTWVTLTGMLIGYVRSYNRTMRPLRKYPRLEKLPTVIVVAMAAGGILIWFVLYSAILMLKLIFGQEIIINPQLLLILLGYLAFNLILSFAVFKIFSKWRHGIMLDMLHARKHGSAYTADEEDLKKYRGKKGFYLGNGYTFSDKGHMLLVAGSRSGKSENILMANLLGIGGYDGSYVVIDPKGELAAVTANRLRQMGKKVIMLNPWDLLPGILTGKRNYNPLSILADKTNPHLIDDIQIIAEMIIPVKPVPDQNEFFASSGRNILASLLLHIAVNMKPEDQTLTKLWELSRLYGKDWDNLLVAMSASKDPINGLALHNAANEIARLMESMETFSSIIAHVLDHTNFLKSPSLQESLVSDFDPYSLADGNTVVFVIIPTDKLKSHANWMRLVVTTMMRAVVRRPKNRVCFLCDEAASLGYVSEFEICLAAYAGYEITLWLIYQDLNQIHAMYGDKWQSIVANSAVRTYFGVKDNFTADYISAACGKTTEVLHKTDMMGNISDVETNERDLYTSDEVMRKSKDNMFVFIGELPVALFQKDPYYKMPALKTADGKNLYDPNPYIKDSL